MDTKDAPRTKTKMLIRFITNLQNMKLSDENTLPGNSGHSPQGVLHHDCGNRSSERRDYKDICITDKSGSRVSEVGHILMCADGKKAASQSCNRRLPKCHTQA